MIWINIKEYTSKRNKINLNNPQYFKEIKGVFKKGLKKYR